MSRLITRFIFSLVLLLSLTNFSYSADPTGSALIVIDMQLPFVTRGGNHKDPENVKKVQDIIAQQVEAIKLARSLKLPIVFIEYEGFGETNPELLKAAEGYGEVKHFIKNSDGMFESYNKSKAEIEKYLKSKNIKNLIITGANGGACVLSSIQGSLQNNFNVTALSKAIADFNYKQFIYPYVYQKNELSWEGAYLKRIPCKDCKFKETDNMETVALEISANQLNNIKEDVTAGDDGAKRQPKYITPTTGEDSGSFSMQQSIAK